MTVLNFESSIRTEGFTAHIKGDKHLVITQGCRFITDEGEAKWIFDAILNAQQLKVVQRMGFQVWKLKRIKDTCYALTLYREEFEEGEFVVQMILNDVNFILSNLCFYYTRGVCMLEKEYSY